MEAMPHIDIEATPHIDAPNSHTDRSCLWLVHSADRECHTAEPTTIDEAVAARLVAGIERDQEKPHPGKCNMVQPAQVRHKFGVCGYCTVYI